MDVSDGAGFILKMEPTGIDHGQTGKRKKKKRSGMTPTVVD